MFQHETIGWTNLDSFADLNPSAALKSPIDVPQIKPTFRPTSQSFWNGIAHTWPANWIHPRRERMLPLCGMT
jgi:hypothetical protein